MIRYSLRCISEVVLTQVLGNFCQKGGELSIEGYYPWRQNKPLSSILAVDGGLLLLLTHTNSIKIRVRSNHIKGVRIDQKAKVSGISSPIVLVNSSGQFESKGFRNLPRNSSLIQFAAKKGGFEFEHCDFELADRLRTDAAFREQYHKETQAQLRAKALRIDNYHYRTKLQEQDRNEIRPEIRQIKQHLVNISAISDQQRVDKEQIHDAYKIITGNRDIRSFDPRLKQYMLHEYVSPLNPEETSFRVTQKFLEI